MIQPALPKGFRDFLPHEVMRRRHLITVMETIFARFGYLPIETPVMEKLETLTGKYGEEGDRLLFKVLESGDYLRKANEAALDARDSTALTPSIAKKGMRYDLTVPLARYAVQHRNDLAFPFKRSHIAPVWRADRPQRGRYREFYQCDVDVVGSDSPFCEAELLRLYAEVFHRLGLKVAVRVNDRRLLTGLMDAVGLGDEAQQAITVLDKLDKIGLDRVLDELDDLGLSDRDGLRTVLETGDVSRVPTNDQVEAGCADLNTVLGLLERHPLPDGVRVERDPSLARGLDYYTGMIVEVVLDEDVAMGSLGGGGRYDDLTGMFGVKDLTGVGVSFGLERIYDVLTELDRWPDLNTAGIDALIVHFDERARDAGYDLLWTLRSAGAAIDIYPDLAKMKKQMKYANDRGIARVILIGDDELASGRFLLKDMATGEQTARTADELARLLTH